MMKRWIMTAAVALAIAVAGCTRQHAVSTVWPDIANPQQLMNDAAVLLTTYRMENVASNAWPAAIKDLTPRYIHVGRAAVYVVLSAAGTDTAAMKDLRTTNWVCSLRSEPTV